MSDDDSDRYAAGHDPERPVVVKHHIWRLKESSSPAELHLTSEEGVHYVFSLTGPQAWYSVRQLTEIISRMSSRKAS